MSDRSEPFRLITAGLVGMSLCAIVMWWIIPADTSRDQIEYTYDRESLTVMRWDRIGVILKSKDDGEVRTHQFDSEDVSFAPSERKAGTALVECIVNADTGEPLWFKRVTLYVSPDDPLAEQEVQPLTEDDASSLENGMSP